MKYFVILGILLIAILPCLAVNTHFSPIWTGNGTEHMNIYVTSASINAIPLTVGDEIAVFDGNLCVGVTRLTSPYNSTISIITSKNEAVLNDPINGFTPGNPIRFAVWHSASNQEIFQGRNLSVVFDNGSNLFTPNETASVQLMTPENLHFLTVWDGNGLDHMNFYVSNAHIQGSPLQPGDEIAVFDGDYCVGSYKIYDSYNSIIPIVVSKNEFTTPINGYTIGNTPLFKIWRSNAQMEYTQSNTNPDLAITVEYTQGLPVFNPGNTATVNICTDSQSFFTKIWTGNGLDHMNFYVNSAMIYGAPLSIGDEIAVFDGPNCVGFTKILYSNQIREIIPIIVSKNDQTDLNPNGYIPGNIASFKIWDSSTNTMIEENQGLFINYDSGQNIFNIGASSSVTLNALLKIANPMFSHESGTYTEAVNLTIASDLPNTTIRITNDGSEPNENSTIYTPPLVLNANQDWVIKAKAFKNNYFPSDVITKSYHITGTLDAPVFSPDPSIPNDAPINISLSCSNPNANIYYTLDGTDPSQSSTLYQGSFLLNSSRTIKAKAFLTDWISSSISEADYVILNVPSNLTASANVNVVSLNWNAVLPLNNSRLRTLNGYLIYRKVGTEVDFSQLTPNLLTVTNYNDTNLSPNTYNYYVVAVYAEGVSANSNIASTQVQKVANPAFNPPAGTYTSAQNIVLTCSTVDAQIRYTIDGSDPNNSSSLYTNPINIPLNTNRTIKAKAFKNTFIDSDIISANYLITGTVATPVFNPAPNTYDDSVSVTMTCSTPGSQIRYTINGTEPTTTSSLYSQAILLTNTTTLKAKAFKTDWTPSLTLTGTYEIQVASDLPELFIKSSLNSPYPNPFNPSTTIKFALAKNSFLTLEVFNVKGQKVKTLISKNMNTGNHEINWDGKNDNMRNLPGGIYLIRMKAENFTQLRKVVLIK